MGLGYEGHHQEVYAKLIFKSAATILREIGCAFFPGQKDVTLKDVNGAGWIPHHPVGQGVGSA